MCLAVDEALKGLHKGQNPEKKTLKEHKKSQEKIMVRRLLGDKSLESTRLFKAAEQTEKARTKPWLRMRCLKGGKSQ